MSLFKIGTLQGEIQVLNNPRAIAAVDTKSGEVYKITNTGNVENAVAFATDAEAKLGGAYVCMNIIDTAELWRLSDFVVKAGSPVRSYLLDTIIGYTVELSSDLVKTAFATVNIGDVLVPCNATDDTATPKQWKVPATQTGYKVAIKVMEKTTFGGTGFYGKLVTV